MHYGQLAKTGASVSLFGLAVNQLWLVGATMIVVGAAALTIRGRFRRGRTPGDQ